MGDAETEEEEAPDADAAFSNLSSPAFSLCKTEMRGNYYDENQLRGLLCRKFSNFAPIS